MARLEEKVDNLKEQADKNDANILWEISEIKQSVKDWIEEADKKYASKTIERIMYGAIGAILLYFLNQVFHLIDIH